MPLSSLGNSFTYSQARQGGEGGEERKKAGLLAIVHSVFTRAL